MYVRILLQQVKEDARALVEDVIEDATKKGVCACVHACRGVLADILYLYMWECEVSVQMYISSVCT